VVGLIRNRELAIGAEFAPRGIAAIIFSVFLVWVFDTKEVRFGRIEVHHPKVGCLGESRIYPKSCDPRAPESAADRGSEEAARARPRGASPPWHRRLPVAAGPSVGAG